MIISVNNKNLENDKKIVLSKMKINKMKFFQDNDHNVTDNEFDNKHDNNGTSMAL